MNENYDAMGELKGALAKKADDFLKGFLPQSRTFFSVSSCGW